jgi:shikimate dehydrogenase
MSVDERSTVTRCGVLGSPIAHSLSPVLHRAAYGALGLDWEYDAYDVTQAQLPAFMAQLTPGWRGLSLTMPLKREVIGLCDRVESLGAMLQSINTVVLEVDGTSSGFNTDVVGVVRALKHAAIRSLDRAIVVGAGATAASAMAAVAQLGADRVTVLVRAPERAVPVLELGPALGLAIDVMGFDDVDRTTEADIVISTIPAVGQLVIADRVARLAPTVFDVIYDPADTPLLSAADRAGARVIAGFELLLHQAARQVELMTQTRSAPVEAMRAAGLAALGNR